MLRNRSSDGWKVRAVIGVAGLLGAACSPALGANYVITWLEMSPTPFNSTVPNASTFNLPGVGNVTMTYNYPNYFTQTRLQNAPLTVGSLTSGGDTYSWTNSEQLATVFSDGPDPLVPIPWSVTYKFPGAQPAGSVFLSVSGLGQTSSFGGGASTATVYQTGNFIGDWSGAGGPWGPTLFTPNNPFTMSNSLTGAGGLDPWWNTPLGVVQITDAGVTSLTVNLSQIRGDGIGVNIGTTLPGPSAMGVLAMALLAAGRRRRVG